MNNLETAKKLINDFCLREYDEEANFEDLTKIPLAYTTDESEENSIQVDVDLENLILSTYINSKKRKQILYESLEDLINIELEHLDFDNLTSDIFENWWTEECN